MDNGFDARNFRLLEGFGYTTSQLRTIYPAYSGLPEIDTTTLPGRNCLSMPAGSNIALRLPRVEAVWGGTTLYATNRVSVLQAKIYLDADTYTNVSANATLASFGSDINFSNSTSVGLSPNTAVNQDNWYLKFADAATDYAVMNPRMELPIIPQRTWVDFKFIIYPVTGAADNDALLFVFINNYIVAWAAGTDLMDVANANELFHGIRLHGLDNQSGPTLWRDVMVYTFPNTTNRTNLVNEFYTPVLSIGASAGTILHGDVFVPMTASVYDITPTTLDGAVNEFVTVGAGSPLTALGTIDNNQYITSTAASRNFRLKIGLPPQYTSEDSTVVSITDASEVLAYSYTIRAKDLNGTNSNMRLRLGDEISMNYQYRYYKLRLGNWLEGTTDFTSGYLQQVYFTSSALTSGALTRLVPGGSTIMRLDNVYGEPALETDPVDRGVNTTLFTGLLTNATASTNIVQPYLRASRLTGLSLADDPSYYMDLHIDHGFGNTGPNWYSLAVNQTQNGFTCKSMVLYGSDDEETWYLLAEQTNLPASTDITYLINRRHPDYASGTIQTLGATSFQLNAAQFDQVTGIKGGDPFTSGNPTYPSTAPTPWGQFKNYTIGIEEI